MVSFRASFGSLLGRRQGKFLGCQPPQGSVRTALIVMPPPRLDLALRVRQRQEPVCVEAFVAQSAVEGLHECVVGRLAGPAEVDGDAVLVSPAVERLSDELWSIIDPDRLGRAAHERQPRHHRNDLLASNALVDFDRQRLAGEGVDHG